MYWYFILKRKKFVFKNLGIYFDFDKTSEKGDFFEFDSGEIFTSSRKKFSSDMLFPQRNLFNLGYTFNLQSYNLVRGSTSPHRPLVGGFGADDSPPFLSKPEH